MLKATSLTDTNNRWLSRILATVDTWRNLNNGIVEEVRAGKRVDSAAIAESTTAGFTAADSVITGYQTYRQGRQDTFRREQEATAFRAKIWLIVLALFALALGLFSPVSGAECHTAAGRGGETPRWYSCRRRISRGRAGIRGPPRRDRKYWTRDEEDDLGFAKNDSGDFRRSSGAVVGLHGNDGHLRPDDLRFA